MFNFVKNLFNRKLDKINFSRSLFTAPIKNVITTLPWHPTKKWGKRTIANIDTILVHQAGMAGTVEEINTYHITPSEKNHLSPSGAPHISYHFVINRNGQILQTNRITDVTWHAKGWNTRAIGVLVLGNFDGPHWKGTEVPTMPQIRNLRRLLNILIKNYNVTKENIKGHGEINELKEACPGTVLLDEVKKFRDKE